MSTLMTQLSLEHFVAEGIAAIIIITGAITVNRAAIARAIVVYSGAIFMGAIITKT